MTLLNLGCGSHYHPDWTNIDIVAHGPGVIAHDLSLGIPLADESAEVVYHSAVLEHIRKADAFGFIKECHRVLKAKGIIRIGVPDLERICRLYLEKLEAAAAQQPGAQDDYDWMLLEMLDQVVREESGGEMLNYLRKKPLPNEPFIYERIGHEGRELVKRLRSEASTPQERVSQHGGVGRVVRGIRKLMRFSDIEHNNGRALAIGGFRLRGEVHQWMYDRFSLARLLTQAGFRDPTLRPGDESAIPGWKQFNLDVHPDGTLRKPDLFFMEAVKPGGGSK